MRSGPMVTGSGVLDAPAIFDVMEAAYDASVRPPPPLVTKTNGMPASATRLSAREPSLDHSRPYLKTPSMSKAMAALVFVSSRVRLLDIVYLCL
jgi:hypothetical protein